MKLRRMPLLVPPGIKSLYPGGIEVSAGVTEFQPGVLRVNLGTASDTEREGVRQNLESYCGQDTDGMVLILDGLCR